MMMIRRLVSGPKGVKLVALSILSIGYGLVILSLLPYWSRMEIAQGSSELQGRFYTPEQVMPVLEALRARAWADAMTFYVIDMPNAVLFGWSLAALIGFGLRLNGWTAWAWVIALPLVSATADLAENALLIWSLNGSPSAVSMLAAPLSLLTATKLVTGNLAILIMLVLVVTGGVRWLVQRKKATSKNMPERLP
jgi:hypothetical protein